MGAIQRMLVSGAAAAATDPFFASVLSLLHFDGVDGSTTITDQKIRTWAVNGNAQLDTAQAKFVPSSLLLDGTGDWITLTSSAADFDMGSGNYTLECFARSAGTQSGSALFATIRSGSGPVHFAIGFCNGTAGSATGAQLFFGFFTGSVWVAAVAPSGLTLNTWQHVAGVRNGTTYTLYVDGVSVATVTDATANPTANTAPLIGRRWENTLPNGFNGHIDEARITKGVARYTANFTPPTAAFPNS